MCTRTFLTPNERSKTAHKKESFRGRGVTTSEGGGGAEGRSGHISLWAPLDVPMTSPPIHLKDVYSFIECQVNTFYQSKSVIKTEDICV